MSAAVYGGWAPTTESDLAFCAAEPFITPAGVIPQWVLDLRAAAASPEVCTCGRFPVRRACTTCNPMSSGPDAPSPVSGPVAASSTADVVTGSPIHNTN